MTAKYYILYNPHAGNGMSKAIAKSLKYEDSEIVAMTEIASYADFLADKQEATLIVCGGDGKRTVVAAFTPSGTRHFALVLDYLGKSFFKRIQQCSRCKGL